MLLKTLGKKKTESEYEKYIARVACSFFSLGILGLFIVRSNSLSDYALGLVIIRCTLLPTMSEINRFCR